MPIITVGLTGQVNAQQRAHDLAQQAGSGGAVHDTRQQDGGGPLTTSSIWWRWLSLTPLLERLVSKGCRPWP